ncbi:MAG: hypothetical protein H6695_16725 [Deferribacteres bacterium]|nr:hypothetical protein [candidate division KSB1 bacterium]MCB9511830.1 hypothetical protein [Deferribacteres bacterium]
MLQKVRKKDLPSKTGHQHRQTGFAPTVFFKNSGFDENSKLPSDRLAIIALKIKAKVFA